MSFSVNSVSRAKPETFTSTSRMDILVAACDYMRNSIPTPGDQTSQIEENAMAAILVATEPQDTNSIWSPCTEDDFEYGLHVYWGDMTNVGTFDKSASLAQHASAMLENRPLTRTEMILAVKCDYIGKHRGWAMGFDFKFSAPSRPISRRCGTKYTPCICSSIEPNLLYDD